MPSANMPEFTEADVALLISAVTQALQHLHDANERQGGDQEFMNYGRRYSLLLDKLNAIGRRSQNDADKGA